MLIDFNYWFVLYLINLTLPLFSLAFYNLYLILLVEDTNLQIFEKFENDDDFQVILVSSKEKISDYLVNDMNTKNDAKSFLNFVRNTWISWALDIAEEDPNHKFKQEILDKFIVYVLHKIN